MGSSYKQLQNKTAVITGCNRGIGKAILESFVSHGANVFACVRSHNADFSAFIEDLAEKHQVEIIPVYMDLSKEEEVMTAAKRIIAAKKQVDIIVNNAGLAYNALFQMSSAGRMKEVFEVNFFSPFLFTQYLVKAMVRKGTGSIINISSTAGIDAVDGKAVYGSSKAALIYFTKVIAAEMKNAGIRANAIAPGLTDTDMLQVLPEKAITRKLASPSQVADLALFLASDQSSHMSGQVLQVDGAEV
jgi:3-oxoacyl-[acyl-carrier protein] reductase